MFDERAQKRIKDIARRPEGASQALLATDPDREARRFRGT